MYIYAYDEPMSEFNTPRDDREDYDYETQRQRRLDEAASLEAEEDILKTT